MKINELNFKPHMIGGNATEAKHIFINGFGVSVITGDMFYTNEACPYEIAVINKHGLTYDTPITNDVIGYLTEDEANTVLFEVEELKATVDAEGDI